MNGRITLLHPELASICRNCCESLLEPGYICRVVAGRAEKALTWANGVQIGLCVRKEFCPQVGAYQLPKKDPP